MKIFSLSLSLGLSLPSDRLLSSQSSSGNAVAEYQDLTEVIESLAHDDPSLSHLNLNNHPLITSQHIFEIISALENNTRVTKLSLANVKFDDSHAAVSILIISFYLLTISCNLFQSLARLLSQNQTLTSLNLDSNRLALEGITVPVYTRLFYYAWLLYQ